MWSRQILVLITALGLASSSLFQRNANTDLPLNLPLSVTDASPAQTISSGTTLRILCVGDSVTVGHGSKGLNGYRSDLAERLSSSNEVDFVGTEHGGAMRDGYFAAWNGKTIQFLADHIGPSLEQRPNLILLHAGTNDMASVERIAKEGNDPIAAAGRLGDLLDLMIRACPDAVIIVAVILGSCQMDRVARTTEYQALIPEVVRRRLDDGHKVLAADFSAMPQSFLRGDCIHPSMDGYKEMGRYWYDFITQIPAAWWLPAPSAVDAGRGEQKVDVQSSGGSLRPTAWFLPVLAWLMLG
ncbi:hypothetical protein HYQ44_004269 [Verticillium longisporum]|nr:hypothetical protein HYQ44_004269 [Verticillium longisporum]